MKHLWEYSHPYYCSDTNYLADYRLNHGQTEFDSWADFLEEFGLEHTDMDYNLLFRWDWKKPDPEDYDLDGEYGEPDELPENDTLHLYYMMQRKGFFQAMLVEVTENDESAVREFLSAYAEHMTKIWSPLLGD